MTLTAKDNRTPSASQGAERRRCKRMPITFPIEVCGIDSTGKTFSDKTVTTDVSADGCRFDLLRPVSRGDEITIRVATRDDEQLSSRPSLRFQIVWVEISDWGWSVGAEKLQPENIWHMAFPKLKISRPSSR